MALVGLFIAAFVVYRVLGWALGAPFMTPDSLVYLDMAKAPLAHMGGHHPAAFPWAIYIGESFGAGPEWVIAAISAAKFTLVYSLLRKVYHSRLAAVPALLFCLWPEMLALDFAAWSESGFIMTVVAISCVLAGSMTPFRTGVCCIALFTLLAEFRHAAIFFLPGAAIALVAYSWGHAGPVKRKWRLGAKWALVWGTSLASAWMLLNVARTGHPLIPSRAKFECAHFLAAYNGLPFCRDIPDNLVCATDPERRIVNNPATDATFYIFSPEGPVRKIGQSEKLCDSWQEIKRVLVTKHPIETVALIGRRVMEQFGEWTSPERGAGLYPIQLVGVNNWFDRRLLASASTHYLVPLSLVAACIAFWCGGWPLRPLLLFLVVGSAGHAIGIAINNPFLAMRYLFIHKAFICLAGLSSIPAIFSWAVGARRNKGPSLVLSTDGQASPPVLQESQP